MNENRKFEKCEIWSISPLFALIIGRDNWVRIWFYADYCRSRDHILNIREYVRPKNYTRTGIADCSVPVFASINASIFQDPRLGWSYSNKIEQFPRLQIENINSRTIDISMTYPKGFGRKRLDYISQRYSMKDPSQSKSLLMPKASLTLRGLILAFLVLDDNALCSSTFNFIHNTPCWII